MKTIFVDTLFILALINQRDQYHDRATELADQYEGHRFLITDAVLLEIGNALARNYKRQAIEIIEQFEQFVSSGDVELVQLRRSCSNRRSFFSEHTKIRSGAWWIASRLSSCVKPECTRR